MMSNSVVKVYKFKLAENVDVEQFVAASQTVDDLLMRTNGFIYRSVARVDDTWWHDIIYWADKASAEAVGSLMNEPEFMALMPLIDMNDVTASQAEVVTQVYPEMTAKTAQLDW